jgi:hypothetical protein
MICAPRHSLVVLSASALFIMMMTVTSVTQGQGPYVLGQNVQVSLSFPDVQHFETQIAADPDDASHLLVGAYIVNSDRSVDNVFYVSFDRGATWTRTLRVAVGTDPAVAIGRHGTAFAATIHDVPRADGNSDSFLVVHRSTDGGRTWQEASVGADSRSVDRNYITIDDDHGRVYVHGYLQEPKDAAGNRATSTFVLYTSADEGRTFNTRVSHQAATPGTPKYVPANAVINPDGTFVVLAALLDAAKLNMFKGRSDAGSAPDLDGLLGVMRSSDEGKTLQPMAPIADVYYDWRVPQLSMAALAVDRSGGPFRGRLYAVWPDARFDRRTQILLASSSDEGRTWSAPRVVSDDRPALRTGDRPNHFMPMVAVNRGGIVAVSWYDRRDNPDNLGYWPRFSASLDGGTTWLPSVRVSTSANLVRDDKEIRFNSGDTAGLAADAGGTFHPVWIDNRTGTHQVWTASVGVRGAAQK